jgi:hypothetical protein
MTNFSYTSGGVSEAGEAALSEGKQHVALG